MINNMNQVIKIMLIITGWLAVLLGVLGIFMPVLPTTPFLLLAASCFWRSSERLHAWLLNSPRLGLFIRNYQEKKGIPRNVKITAITMLWLSISVSAFFFISKLLVRVLLFAIAIAVTVHLLQIKTLDSTIEEDDLSGEELVHEAE